MTQRNWKNHCWLGVSALVTVILVLTRPDVGGWEIPGLTFLLWGGGHAIIVRIEGRPGSRETAELKEELKRKEMIDEYERDKAFPIRRDMRKDARGLVLFSIAFLAAVGILLWLASGGATWVEAVVNGTLCGRG